jgi:hypothetical protein
VVITGFKQGCTNWFESKENEGTSIYPVVTLTEKT